MDIYVTSIPNLNAFNGLLTNDSRSGRLANTNSLGDQQTSKFRQITKFTAISFHLNNLLTSSTRKDVKLRLF